MWKRETKLGLVVSGSFLCLLGAILGRKLLLHEAPQGQDGEAQAVAQGPENPKAGSGAEPGIFPLKSVKHEEIKTLPGSSILQTPILPQYVPGGLEPGKGPPSLPPGPTIPENTLPPGEVQVQSDLEKAAKEAKMGKFAKNPKKPAPLPPAVPEFQPPVLPGPLVMAAGPIAQPGSDGKIPPPPPAEIKPPAPPPVPSDLPGHGTVGALPVPVGPVSSPGLPAGPPDKDKITPPAIPTNTADKKDGPPSVPALPPTPGGTGKVELPPPTAVIPPTPPGGAEPGLKKGNVPAGSIHPLSPPGGPSTKVDEPNSKPPVQPPSVTPPLGTDPKTHVGPVNGITVPVVTAPEKSPANPPVQEYSLEAYQWQPGMTFPILSKQKYEHEKYADALLLFNRDFPGGSIWLKQNPPIVKPGETIFVPQLIVLQTKYANAIPKGPAAAATPSYSAKAPEAPSAAAPPFAPPGIAATPVKVSDAPAPGLVKQTPSGPMYTVAGDKEMIFEIAQKTLGEGRRWTEIWYLNRQLIPDPSRPIPAGTQLWLPGKK